MKRLGLYILRRALVATIVLFLVTIITFVVQRVLPASPVDILVGPFRTPESVRAVTKQLGLDKPIYEQYRIYLAHLLHGDLGVAWHTGHSVVSDIGSRLPASLELEVFGLGLAVPLGVLAGIISARRRDKLTDHVLRISFLTGIAVPEFLVALLAIYIFFFRFQLVPAPLGRLTVGMEPPQQITGLYVVDSLLTGNWSDLRDSLEHLILPAATLAFVTAGVFARFTRASMIEALSSDSVLAERSYGLPERLIVYKYALKNALLPVVSVFGVVVAQTMGGLVVIETIFAWPGLGRYAVDSFQASDFSAVEGFVFISTITYILVNLIVDVLQAIIDPRLAY